MYDQSQAKKRSHVLISTPPICKCFNEQASYLEAWEDIKLLLPPTQNVFRLRMFHMN